MRDAAPVLAARVAIEMADGAAEAALGEMEQVSVFVSLSLCGTSQLAVERVPSLLTDASDASLRYNPHTTGCLRLGLGWAAGPSPVRPA